MNRATLHMSQELWDLVMARTLWLSSKGHTMGVGKAILCSQWPSSIVWSENGACCRAIAYFVGGKKEGRIWLNIKCLKLYQFERITLVVFVYPEICSWICHAIYLEICHVGKSIRKSHRLPELASDPPRGVGPDENYGRPWNLIHSPPCRTSCRLFIHLWVKDGCSSLGL